MKYLLAILFIIFTLLSCKHISENELSKEHEDLMLEYHEKLKRIKEVEAQIDSIIQHDEKLYKQEEGISDTVDLNRLISD